MSYHVSDSERGREDIQYDTDELLTVTVHQAMMAPSDAPCPEHIVLAAIVGISRYVGPTVGIACRYSDARFIHSFVADCFSDLRAGTLGCVLRIYRM